MALPEERNSGDDFSDSDSQSDDSLEDPTYHIAKEIRSSLSSLSIGGKSKARASGQRDEDTEANCDKLDEKEQKDYNEIIQKLIEAGNVEKLKVDQCKVYLRKHGLRLAGTKETLIQRIKEHREIYNGEGEKKYPASSFVVNCKGDACTGDVVLFEQNVYEMFSIASRSATGPPCGTRVVAGRIVKESYGTAKQQHTFTIEVLWSKGEKPLPPLHPLLIKGRNLYRLKTMRQKWEDEEKRQNMLTEKHARGFVARSKRETRLNNREIRKRTKANGVVGTTDVCRKGAKNSGKAPKFSSDTPKNKVNQCQQPEITQNSSVECQDMKGFKDNLSCRPTPSLKDESCSEMPYSKRQPLSTVSCNLYGGVPSDTQVPQQHYNFANRSSTTAQRWNQNGFRGNKVGSFHFQRQAISQQNLNLGAAMSTFQGPHRRFNPPEHLVSRTSNKSIQVCRYYAQGRCYYGDNCKYLHADKGN